MSAANLFLDLWDVAVGDRTTVESADAPEWAVLRMRLREATVPDPDTAATHIRAGLDYRENGNNDAAHAHFRAAFVYDMPSAEVCLHVAATLIKTGDLTDAEAVLRRAVIAKLATPQIYVHLAHAVWGQRRTEDALQIIRAAAVQTPDDYAVIETAALLEFLAGQHERALAFLDGCQPAAYSMTMRATAVQASIAVRRDLAPEVLVLLATATAVGDTDAIRLQSMLTTQKFARTVWLQLISTHTVKAELAAALRESPCLNNILQLERPARVLALGSDDAASHYGNNLVHRDALIQEGFALPRSEGVAARGFMTTDLLKRRGLISSARRVQLDILRCEAVHLLSPFGGVQKSRSGTVINYCPDRRELGSVIAYYFHEPRPSFALFMTEEHWPLAWYDPIDDIILRHDEMPEFELYLQHRIIELKEVWLRLSEDVARYLADDRRVTALYPAIVDYISTHLFAELQGLSQILDQNALRHVGRIVCLSPEPFGPIEKLFPEYAGIVIERKAYTDEIELNEALFRQRHFPVRITGGMVDDTMAARVTTHAEMTVSSDWAADVTRLRKNCSPLLFVSFRVHSRKLLLSDAEIAGVFEQIASTYPDIGLIFDGHAVADRPVSTALLEREAALVDGITGHLSIPMLRSGGRSMSDSIYAAMKCDLHLSEQGTSTTKGALIADLPGVVIGPKQFGWDVRAFRDPPPLLMTPWDRAEDVVQGDIQTDYRLDPDVIVQSLLEVIKVLQ